MRLHSLGKRQGPYDDVLVGEMSIADVRHFSPERIVDEVYSSIRHSPELDRRYRGRMMTPVIVVVHHQADHFGGRGSLATSASMIDNYSFNDLGHRYDQVLHENRQLRAQLEKLSNPYVTPKETNENLLLL